MFAEDLPARMVLLSALLRHRGDTLLYMGVARQAYETYCSLCIKQHVRRGTPCVQLYTRANVSVYHYQYIAACVSGGCAQVFQRSGISVLVQRPGMG